MALEQASEQLVDAVVVDDGQLLLVNVQGGWGLPSGVPEEAETAQATAARVVYELTGYLVDGSSLLEPEPAAATDGPPAVVCHLLSQDPSGEAQLTAGQLRWAPFAEAIEGGLPAPVRTYLEGHTPV
ncbi:MULTISPECIES: NUDIX domain-containing protein [unclassified Streptomyces]|uniref:NUDIX domain-containing protein n=1 Tax=unclassified Streptomyces TaxID=2593676 RepID=UPI00190CDA90|nr:MULTISPECIES: NUDIX domain-containing protein [unclassified Streptomyces]MBK3567486.1 NUDIX hydrolase [Streptomyces sp. MBT62]MBK6010623.1 NUDIX hydrolase [Streptomyces sp. MBT53]